MIRNVSLCAALLFLLSGNYTQAALPEGRHGWFSPMAAVVGNDITCGVGEVRMDIELVEYGTNNPLTVQSGYVLVYNKSTFATVDSSTGPGPILPSVCLNPATEGMIFDIAGGTQIYDITGNFDWENPDAMPKGVHYRQRLMLTRTASPVRYGQVSPVNTVVRVNPSYVFALNSFPSDYGATGIKYASFFLDEYDPATGEFGDMVDNRRVNLSGGVGNKTIPPTPNLADGIYTWSGYLSLNGTHAITASSTTYTSLDVSKTGFMRFSTPFMLDATAPTIASTSGHVPVSPEESDTVTLTGEASDALSGVTQMKVFVNGVDSRTCNFAAVNDAVCALAVGPFAASTTVSYFFTATDMAGNTATSSVQNFTITPPPPPPPPPPIGTPVTCEIPASMVSDSAVADGPVADGTPQALKIVGNYAYVGASGPDTGNGLYIYDISDTQNVVQLSFFSTHSPAAVQNYSWGNDVLGLTVEGNYAYLATYFGGLVIVDISNPSAPTFVGKVNLSTLNAPGLKETWAVEVEGNYAYLAAGRGMIVIDVSNKAAPTVVQNINLGATVAQDITLQGNYAFVVMRDAGFAILDISNPLSVVTVSTLNDAYNANSWAYAVAIEGNYLYVANHFSGNIRIYDVTTKSNPVFMASATIPGATEVRGLFIEDGVLFAGTGATGAYVFDISNPIDPELLYQVTSPELLPSARVWDVLPLATGNFTEIAMVSEDMGAGLYVVDTTCEPVLLPDLVATSTLIFSSGTAVPGQTLTFSTGDIFNLGTSTAPGYSFGGLYIDATGDGIADYQPLLPAQAQVTPVGSSTETTVNWMVPVDATAGTYRVGYTVNDPSSFDEIDYDNNWSGWTAFTVEVPSVPAVSPLTASPNPIMDGGSTELEWTVSGSADWCWLEGTGGGWQDPAPGTKNLMVAPPSTETYTIECGNTTGNSPIQSREVVVNIPASIALSPVGCYIAASSSTCDGQVSWAFISATAPYVVENTTNDIVYGTTVSESGVIAVLNEGPNTIVARDSAGNTRTETVAGICDSSVNTWDAANNICVANPLPPAVAVTTEFTLVRSGVSAPLEIQITSTEALTCELRNAQESLIEFSHDPALGVTQDYNSYTTRPLTSAQLVTVSCSVDAYPGVIGTDELRINVIGIMEEV